MVSASPREIFATANVDIDSEGRVTLADPIARTHWLGAVSREKPKPVPNTNCNGCNTVKGCGPINTVDGCSGKLRG
jgi:hypothetical protein